MTHKSSSIWSPAAAIRSVRNKLLSLATTQFIIFYRLPRSPGWKEYRNLILCAWMFCRIWTRSRKERRRSSKGSPLYSSVTCSLLLKAIWPGLFKHFVKHTFCLVPPCHFFQLVQRENPVASEIYKYKQGHLGRWVVPTGYCSYVLLLHLFISWVKINWILGLLWCTMA